jgi:hypothetical protein
MKNFLRIREGGGIDDHSTPHSRQGQTGHSSGDRVDETADQERHPHIRGRHRRAYMVEVTLELLNGNARQAEHVKCELGTQQRCPGGMLGFDQPLGKLFFGYFPEAAHEHYH